MPGRRRGRSRQIGAVDEADGQHAREERRHRRWRPAPSASREPVRQPLPAEVPPSSISTQVRHAADQRGVGRAPAPRRRAAADPPGGAERGEQGGEQQRQERQRHGDQRPPASSGACGDQGRHGVPRPPRSVAVDVEAEVLRRRCRRRCRCRGSRRSLRRSGRADRCPPCAARRTRRRRGSPGRSGSRRRRTRSSRPEASEEGVLGRRVGHRGVDPAGLQVEHHLVVDAVEPELGVEVHRLHEGVVDGATLDGDELAGQPSGVSSSQVSAAADEAVRHVGSTCSRSR